jgi:tetraacyldisaccharide 4'-kinase
VAAFCGLGNPAAFWQTLAALGHRPLLRREFPDHHRYRPAELRKLALQAAQLNCAALLTTEKDLMNLPEGSPRLVQPLRLCWLKIGVEIDQGEQLLRRMPRS